MTTNAVYDEMLEALLLVKATIKEWDFGENDYTLAELIIGTHVEKAINDAIDHAQGES